MYLDAVKEIQSLEQRAEQERTDARGRARKLVADARRDGEALVSETKKAAAKADADALKTCEQQAKQRHDVALQEAEAQCRSLRHHAAENMDEAVSLIVEKVVRC